MDIEPKVNLCPARQAPLSSLLSDVRQGDRGAAAELGLRFAPEIRRRVRGQLGPEMRRLFDSNDIVSTVLRRLDVYVQGNSVRAESEREIRALLLRICQNAVTDKVRVLQRLRRVEGEDTQFARALLFSLESRTPTPWNAPDDRLSEVFELLQPGIDRKILWFWLAGHDFTQIASNLDLSHAAVRKRWQRLREYLREYLEGANS